MPNINITCDICKKTHSVRRTDEIPEEVTEIFCNWCPECEDKAEDYYTERYGYKPIVVTDKNQTDLFQ